MGIEDKCLSNNQAQELLDKIQIINENYKIQIDTVKSDESIYSLLIMISCLLGEIDNIENTIGEIETFNIIKKRHIFPIFQELITTFLNNNTYISNKTIDFLWKTYNKCNS